ncbi:hypothetical protein J7E63_26790 [Bacillus sp. ISL-75]|uniref:hypothetical protein n=1 Tax=Bacillus sp. ISL-75 TaxID=2819137 RepID=UPI001BEBC4E5|nr:hypothetical protein [Bacillus sp. ISL-75]MBT2730440.1 hypothetical protein [Bacillus sp. ISL-75]
MNNIVVMFGFLAFLPFIINFLLTVFGFYFVIKVTKFMNTKTKLDQEKNEIRLWVKLTIPSNFMGD